MVLSAKRVKIAVNCLGNAKAGQPCLILPLGSLPITLAHYSCQINDLSSFLGVWNTLSSPFSLMGSSEVRFPVLFFLSQTLGIFPYHEWCWMGLLWVTAGFRRTPAESLKAGWLWGSAGWVHEGPCFVCACVCMYVWGLCGRLSLFLGYAFGTGTSWTGSTMSQMPGVVY